MLKIGDKAPSFAAPSSQGGTLTSLDLKGQAYVLYFYPKSFTRGCTIETRRFAERAPEFEALGAKIIGVSLDPIETQCKFASKTGADFALLADDGSVSKAFDVKRFMLPITKRVTYLINREGVVDAVYASERKFEEHVDELLTHLSAEDS